MMKRAMLAAAVAAAMPVYGLAQDALTGPQALDAYEQALLTPPHLQPMSYGGGLEWTFEPEANCRIYVREYGDPANDTWVILHGGWGAEHSYLLDALAGLEQHYHLVFYDQRGSLRSSCPAGSISIGAHIADLDQLRELLGLETVNLLGHSMGTHLAGRYLDRHPENTGRIIMLAATGLKHPLDEAEQAAAPAYGNFRDFGEQMLSRPEVEAELAAIGPDSEDMHPRQGHMHWRVHFAAGNMVRVEHWPVFRGGMVFYDSQAGSAAARGMLAQPYDFRALLDTHGHSVDIIIGDHDYVDPGAAMSRYWFEEGSPVRLTVLENAGHAAWLDRPRAFRTALVEAMSRGRE